MELWKGLSAIDMRGYLTITMLVVKANGNLQQQIGLLMAQILQELRFGLHYQIRNHAQLRCFDRGKGNTEWIEWIVGKG